MILTKPSKSGKLPLWTPVSRRYQPCPAPEITCPTPRKALPAPAICPRPSSKNAKKYKPNRHAHSVAQCAENTARAGESSGTSAVVPKGGPSIFNSSIPCIIARNVASISTSIRPTWLLPVRIIPMRSPNSPSGLSSRTGCLIERPVGISGGIIEFLFHLPRFKTGSRRREKKRRLLIETDDYLNVALENFSGYIAVDEVYDGPFCILSIVDNREFRRLTYRVLERSPKKEDIHEFLNSFKNILARRGLSLKGITTDGSNLYPEAIKSVFPGVRHQICVFHVLKEINRSILKAVTKVRRELNATKTKRTKRGRPTDRDDKQLIKKNERIQAKITALFDNRFLFVQRSLTKKERATFHEITKGFPELRKLREIMEEVYRLFDRRCTIDTALEKLRKLRTRVKRFKELSKSLSKLESPTLEKSLVFLSDKQLPSTSNAVERGNRRHRKMQKTVYRVRTKSHIENRIALDMYRESRLPRRRRTTERLHWKRCDELKRTCQFHEMAD